MVITLFTVRFVLEALGQSDYGIFMIIGGIISMLEILNANMSTTSMRFMAYSLGSDNFNNKIKSTFSTTVIIHLLIGFLTILILEIGGFIMFEWFLNIPIDRVDSAKIVYQIMVFTTLFTITAVPYDAVMNAHEHLYILSIFDVLFSIATLLNAYFLMDSSGNRLVQYSFVLMIIQFVLMVIKIVFARLKYVECRCSSFRYFEVDLFKNIMSFTGWNLFSNIASLGMIQFRSLIINNFFGVKLNAAEGISKQASTPVNMIVASMTKAINPQIMKNEAGGNRDKMIKIVEYGSKYSTFIFAAVSIPILFEIPFLLKIWIGNVPKFAEIFCQLTLIGMFIEKFTFQIIHAVSAVGDIKGLQIYSSIASLAYLPFSYFLFSLGYEPYFIYLLSIASILLLGIIRLYYGKKVVGINILEFLNKTVVSVLLPCVFAIIPIILLYTYLSTSIIRVIIECLIFIIVLSILFWKMSLDGYEKNIWRSYLCKLF